MAPSVYHVASLRGQPALLQSLLQAMFRGGSRLSPLDGLESGKIDPVRIRDRSDRRILSHGSGDAAEMQCWKPLAILYLRQVSFVLFHGRGTNFGLF